MTDSAGVEITRYRVKSKLTTRCCLRSCQGCTDMSCTPSSALLIVELHQLPPLPRALPPPPRATSSLVLLLCTYVDMNSYAPCVKIHTPVSWSCVYVRMLLTQGERNSETREARREGRGAVREESETECLPFVPPQHFTEDGGVGHLRQKSSRFVSSAFSFHTAGASE